MNLNNFFEKTYKIKTFAAISQLSTLIYNNSSPNLTWMQFFKNNWLENPENLYLQNIQRPIWNLPKYLKIKKIFHNLKTMIFRSLQNTKSITKVADLKMVNQKLVIIATNLLFCYIFFKVCLYLYLKPT